MLLRPRPSPKTQKAVSSFHLNTADFFMRTHGKFLCLQKCAEMGIIRPWCNPRIAVLSGYDTRTGLLGAGNTPQPAAIHVVIPIVQYFVTDCKGSREKLGGGSSRRCKKCSPSSSMEPGDLLMPLRTGREIQG